MIIVIIKLIRVVIIIISKGGGPMKVCAGPEAQKACERGAAAKSTHTNQSL